MVCQESENAITVSFWMTTRDNNIADGSWATCRELIFIDSSLMISVIRRHSAFHTAVIRLSLVSFPVWGSLDPTTPLVDF